MKNIVYLALLFLLPPLALSVPFSYDGNRKIHFSNRDFQRYIHPKLGHIKRDFFSLFNNFNELYPDLIKGRKLLSAILTYQNSLLSECRKSVPKCEVKIQQLKKELLDFELFFNALEIKIIRHKFTNNHPNIHTLWPKDIFDLHLEILKVSGRIRQAFFFHGVNHSVMERLFQDLPHLFRSLWLNYERFFFGPLLEDKRKLLTQVYYSFILPIDKYILRPHSPEYLKKNIETLNFSWNDFYMKISKTNRHFSTKTLSLAQQIHQRWISILRIMLR